MPPAGAGAAEVVDLAYLPNSEPTALVKAAARAAGYHPVVDSLKMHSSHQDAALVRALDRRRAAPRRDHARGRSMRPSFTRSSNESEIASCYRLTLSCSV